MIGSYGSHQCCHRPLNNCISLSFCFCSIRRFQIPKVGPRKFNVVRYNQTAPRHFRPHEKIQGCLEAEVVSRPRLSCGWKCLGANQTCTQRFKIIKNLNPPNKLLISLESGIDIGQGINVGPGKFVKKSKRGALNKRRAWTKCAKLCYKKPIKLENICRPWKKFQNLINVGPLIRL